MKVGIITITDGANYGNRLQNYALQESIKTMGYSVCTLMQPSYNIKFNYFKEIIKHLIKRETNIYQLIRNNRFKKFNKKYITLENEFKDKCDLIKTNYKYDYFICGSDQVWNVRYDFIYKNINNYLASFANPEKRIAYAASFGTSNVSEKTKYIFKRELSKFKTIGVREVSAVNIIKQITGRDDVKVVLDPTMLLTRDDWIKIEKKPRYIENESFFVTYFLGGRSEKIDKYIKKLEIKYNCKSINLDIEFKSDSQIENKDYFITSPDEFIWLIHNAKCILTDSFHATVFSILFHKPFYVFGRKTKEKNNNMETRIDTLLSYFGLQNCMGDIENPNCLPFQLDGEKIDCILEERKKTSLDFLQASLDYNVL